MEPTEGTVKISSARGPRCGVTCGLDVDRLTPSCSCGVEETGQREAVETCQDPWDVPSCQAMSRERSRIQALSPQRPAASWPGIFRLSFFGQRDRVCLREAWDRQGLVTDPEIPVRGPNANFIMGFAYQWLWYGSTNRRRKLFAADHTVPERGEGRVRAEG